VLIGCAVVIAVRCVRLVAYYFIPLWFGRGELGPPVTPLLDVLTGPRFFISAFCGIVVGRILSGLSLLCLFFLMKVLLRNQTVAFIVCVLIFSLSNAPIGNLWSFLVIIVLSPIFFIVLIRFGFVTAIIALFVDAIIVGLPAFLEPSAWYSGYGYAALLILAVIVLYAFRYSLGGRPIFGTPRLDD
jgi:hypothetical protein